MEEESSVNICYFKMLIKSQKKGLDKLIVSRSITYHQEKLVLFSRHFVVDAYKINDILPHNKDLVFNAAKGPETCLVQSLNLTEEENTVKRADSNKITQAANDCVKSQTWGTQLSPYAT